MDNKSDRTKAKTKKRPSRSKTKNKKQTASLSTSKDERTKTIKDYFPVVRRSSRKCKSLLEDEKIENIADRLRRKVEEGLEAVEVEGKGRGVVSTRKFLKDELVCEYSGELLSHKEAQQREELYAGDESIGCYMYYFKHGDKSYCVDATVDNGRMGRLLNHRKTSPNVTTKVYMVDDRPYLCLVAARDLEPGEELEYDYGERSKPAILSHPWLTK